MKWFLMKDANDTFWNILSVIGEQLTTVCNAIWWCAAIGHGRWIAVWNVIGYFNWWWGYTGHIRVVGCKWVSQWIKIIILDCWIYMWKKKKLIEIALRLLFVVKWNYLQSSLQWSTFLIFYQTFNIFYKVTLKPLNMIKSFIKISFQKTTIILRL